VKLQHGQHSINSTTTASDKNGSRVKRLKLKSSQKIIGILCSHNYVYHKFREKTTAASTFMRRKNMYKSGVKAKMITTALVTEV